MQSYEKNKYDAILHKKNFLNVAKTNYPRVASKLPTCRWTFTNVSLANDTLVNCNLYTSKSQTIH